MDEGNILNEFFDSVWSSGPALLLTVAHGSILSRAPGAGNNGHNIGRRDGVSVGGRDRFNVGRGNGPTTHMRNNLGRVRLGWVEKWSKAGDSYEWVIWTKTLKKCWISSLHWLSLVIINDSKWWWMMMSDCEWLWVITSDNISAHCCDNWWSQMITSDTKKAVFLHITCCHLWSSMIACCH